MKKSLILLLFAITFSKVFSKADPVFESVTEAPFSWQLDDNISINQTANQTGAVLIKGNFTKPVTSDVVILSVKYKNSLGSWIQVWFKSFGAQESFKGNITSIFELPASINAAHDVKVEINSNTDLTNWEAISWDKSIAHYKRGDYAVNVCSQEPQENKYTILITPKKNGSILYNHSGALLGVKDRVNSSHIFNKKDDVVFTLNKTSTLINDSNGAKSIKITNNGALTDVLASTPVINYNSVVTRPTPYSYNDPVYIFAGKFSNAGFLMKFSQWEDDNNGVGYHNFRNPDVLTSRYFNLYNDIDQKLSNLFTNQEPIVIVSSKRTGLRVYKKNKTYINLIGHTNYDPTETYFGYSADQGGEMRGPGSENFIISNTPETTIYGMGVIRNDQFGDNALAISDIEIEVNKFINDVGIFGVNYNSETSDCITINSDANPDFVPTDFTKAPNSFIYDPTSSSNGDGLYIPVKKAYAMWKSDKIMGGLEIPAGTVTADVLWEDVHGLIKSGTRYALEITGADENAKIKVPINKAKEGNAVIVYKVNGVVYWSWHVWVTDNPTNGSTYKSFPDVKREKPDGSTEIIPDNEWQWMDRNLGAVASTITEGQGIKNGGLLYQFGRKDPLPALVYKEGDFYEVSGSVGRVRHRQARNLNNAVTIDSFTKYPLLSNSTVKNNVRLATNNPLSLIYVNNNDNTEPAYYNNNKNLMVNWFGTDPILPADRLSELNLWSDNSQGKIGNGYNADASAAPYRSKSAYDPCPNGWRIPSMLVANLANTAYADDIRVDFSPFGVRTNIENNVFTTNKFNIIKPNDNTTPSYLKGIKVYANTGMDFSNVGGYNMGVFPGTGSILRVIHEGQYADQHHTGIWTATMAKHFDGAPVVSARAFGLISDIGQPDIPDATLPAITGRFIYYPLGAGGTSDAVGCRCVKDPLYTIASYDFPTEYFTDASNFTEGLSLPNSYQMVKNADLFTVEIPVTKAFSAQSQLLNNPSILNAANFNNLKANVLWTTNTNLINKVTIQNPSPGSLFALTNSKILVEVKPNQSGNAVVTLHNGSITNPVYWSWHIWITDTPVGYNTYTTELPNSAAPNYVNYIKPEQVMKTDIMDRDLGANEVITEANKTITTAGLHYQWGRKDPHPVFVNANRNANAVYLGTVQASGAVLYASLNSATYYSNAYLKNYNDYALVSNVVSTQKPADKISGILSYSVKNPLIFMVPSALSVKKANINHTNGSDWLSSVDEPNLAADRWGRGSEKSPFDPCPEGWRIPDVTGSAVSASNIGGSPFYKQTNGGISILTNFGGVRINRSPYSSAAIGYSFANSTYPIGSYANALIRGSRNTIEGMQTVNYNALEATYGGFWLGSLNSNYTGRAMRVEIQYNGNYIIPYSSNADPYFGASCRCVKVKYDENGLEQSAVPKLQVTSLTSKPAASEFTKADITEINKNKELKVFPNPVISDLYINGDSSKEYYFQLYSMSGQLVLKGKFENNKINLVHLPTGQYIIRINNEKEIFKIIKE